MRLFHLEIVSHDILLEFLVHIGISGEHRLKSFAFLTVKVVLRDFCHKTAQRIRHIRFGTAIRPLKVSSIAQISSPWIAAETAISST